uniref:ArfGAP with RhoGAP domain, ankyrin repeat and PH domain 3 n=1 Tax=Crocodylus porosus TaxID=8502 RepID=A0A7M4E3Y4_CROPO
MSCKSLIIQATSGPGFPTSGLGTILDSPLHPVALSQPSLFWASVFLTPCSLAVAIPIPSASSRPWPCLRPFQNSRSLSGSGSLPLGSQVVFSNHVPIFHRRNSEYSSEGRSEDEKSRAQLINRIIQNDTEGYSTVEAPQAEGSQFSLPLHLYPDEVLDDLTISPYASYTSLSEKPPNMLSGWLDKLSPQGNYVFQRRYVRFDGKNLMYFNSEKDPYPKGVIPLSVIEMARSTKENKFQVVTSHRIFVFRAENEAQRNKWCSTMQKKVAEQRQVSPRPRHTSNSHWQKCGCLEFKGHKSKVFAVLSLAEMWLYKSEQFFKMGIGICLIELRGATIREAKHRSFELITPFKIFSFTAESEREKREWMEALQDAIAETLYDYEVAEKIWSNKANKFCADCRAMSPDWASINLCVVICKQCAGQHRGLGSNISKVQSLKLDTSVWSNEIVQLFIVLGNERANQFWSPHIPPSEALYPDASAEQRREFITCKYRDGRYRLQHPSYSTQEELLQVSAGLGWHTKANMNLGEWAHASFGGIGQTLQRVLQVLHSNPDLQQLGADGPDTLQAWASAIGKWFTPVSCHCLLGYEFQKVGQLRYKSMLNPDQWLQGFFILQKAHLFICPVEEKAVEDSINLRRLQELSDPRGKDVHSLHFASFVLRTFYLQGVSRVDFAAWCMDIQASAGGWGNALRDQQLSRSNIPIIVDSCIAFITQYEIHQKAQRLERYKELINHLPHLNRKTLAALIGHLYRVQKCADFNQMGTKNLSLLFAPSLFQTDGKGEHEVKVMEDLIDNYVCIFNIDEDQVSQMDLENSLITTWKDVQLSQAGDLIIEVYLEQKLLDCCVTLKVSPSMTAEELTNQVLEMRSVAASLDIWLTFEALENGELERPLHPKEKVLEQALQWCKLPEPSSAYLLVRKVPIGEGGCLFTGAKRESPKCGLLKCREEHPKLLGSKFQERYFVIRDRKLLLLKEKRSAKPEREWPLDSARVYMGIRKKLKPPSQYLACTGQAELWDWITSILKAQHDDLRSVILRRRSSSDLSKQKFGTMPLHQAPNLSPLQPMKMHQDSLDEQQEKEAADAEPVYEEVGNFPTLSPLELDRGLLAELSQVPAVDRSVKPTLFSEQSQHPALRSSLPPSPGQKVSSMPFTKALSLERGLNLQSEKALYHARSSGVRPTKTASLERNLEPSQVLPALAQEQVAEENQRPVLEPLFGKAPPPEASKKISHLPSPINDKLMQELSSVILRKNEGQAPELGPVQQIT